MTVSNINLTNTNSANTNTASIEKSTNIKQAVKASEEDYLPQPELSADRFEKAPPPNRFTGESFAGGGNGRDQSKGVNDKGAPSYNPTFLDSVLGRKDEKRAKFLDHAKQKGLIKEQPVVKANKAPAGAPQAPDGPRLIVNDPKLPSDLRDAIHEENIHQIEKYQEEYRKYADSYRDKVDDAESFAELRKLGPAAPGVRIEHEPGVKANNSSRDKSYRSEWLDEVGVGGAVDKVSNDFYVTQKEVSSKVNELGGKSNPGSVFVNLEASYTIKTPGDNKIASKKAIGVRIDDQGRVTTAKKGELSVTVNGVTVAKEKATTTKRFGQNQTPQEEETYKASVGNDKIGSIGVSSDGNTELQSPEVKVGVVGVKGSSSYNPNNQEITQGAEGTVDLKVVELSGKAEIGFKGIDAKTIANALDKSNPGFFSAPERDLGLKWEHLSESRQKFYAETHGWSAAEWNAK